MDAVKTENQGSFLDNGFDRLLVTMQQTDAYVARIRRSISTIVSRNVTARPQNEPVVVTAGWIV